MVKSDNKYRDAENTDAVNNNVNKKSNHSNGILNSAFYPSYKNVFSVTRQLSNEQNKNLNKNNIENNKNNNSENSIFSIHQKLDNNNNRLNKGKATLTDISLKKETNNSKSSSINSSSQIPSKNNRVLKRPAILIGCILVSIFLAITLIGGIIYLVIKAQSELSKLEKSSNNQQLKNNNTNNLNLTIYEPGSDFENGIINNLSNTVATHKTSNSVERCGIQKHPPNIKLTRIMRGHEALPRSWPWTVSIGYYGPRTSLPHACGGTLINKRFVITATHCVLENSIFSLVGNPIPNSDLYKNIESMMRIYVGVTNRTSDIKATNTYRVSKIMTYPDFDTNSFKNDIAIIKLDKDIVESDSVSYICLNKNTETMPSTDVFAVGWGFTENNFYRASDMLNQVKIQIRPYDLCGLAYIPILQFCAGDPKNGKDTCNGDSGGPLMQQKDNKWTLVGVVSNGDALCTGRGIYTNVSFFYDWIIENTIIK